MQGPQAPAAREYASKAITLTSHRALHATVQTYKHTSVSHLQQLAHQPLLSESQFSTCVWCKMFRVAIFLLVECCSSSCSLPHISHRTVSCSRREQSSGTIVSPASNLLPFGPLHIQYQMSQTLRDHKHACWDISVPSAKAPSTQLRTALVIADYKTL